MRKSVSQFQESAQLYFEGFKTKNNAETIIRSGIDAAVQGEAIGHAFNRFNSLGFEARRLAQQIIKHSRSINTRLETKRDEFIRGLSNYQLEDLPKLERDMKLSELAESRAKASNSSTLEEEPPTTTTVKEPKNKQASAKLSGSEQDSRTDKSQHQLKAKFKEELDQSKKRFEKLEAKTQQLTASYNSKLARLSSTHEETVTKLEKARKEIRLLEGREKQYSSSQSLQQTAEQEGKRADFYRYLSLGYLGIFFVVAIYLIAATTLSDYDSTKTLIRTILAVALLSPLIFVVRESFNHRKQQQSYMQKAFTAHPQDIENNGSPILPGTKS